MNRRSDPDPADAIPVRRTRPSLLRVRGPHGPARVANIELFFDLVFAFAITQLSHTLLGRLTVEGALETGVLFLAVWWVWTCTAVATHWLDPERSAVRVMIFALMLAGLLMACALPQAFDAEGPRFAGCYVGMQIGGTLFLLWALGDEQPRLTRNFRRVTVWFSVSALLWIAGAQAGHADRVLLWTGAVAIEYGAAWIGFWVPGLGRSPTRHGTLESEHLAERCALFVTLALGESLLVTGTTVAAGKATPAHIAAFAVAFVGSVALWWIYFSVGDGRGDRGIARGGEPGRLARGARIYVHLPIVAGIVVAAVADELLLAHPSGPVEARMLVPMLGGPALFLLGNLAFRTTSGKRLPLSHGVGCVLLAATAFVAPWLEPLGVGATVGAILVVVAAWETISLGRAAPVADPHASRPARIW